MAIGDAYVTLTELKSYMRFDDSDPDRDALLTAAIGGASRGINEFCNRQFNDAGTATARLYNPFDTKNVYVDDFHTTTGLIVETMLSDDVWTAVTDYTLKPLNGIRNGVPGWPYWHVVAKRNAVFEVRSDEPTVRVTARWGWATVPDPIKNGCKQLAAEAYQMRDSRMGLAGSDQFGTIIRVRDNQLVKGWLQPFRFEATRVA